jgi:hypothetical protein
MVNRNDPPVFDLCNIFLGTTTSVIGRYVSDEVLQN